MKLVSHRENTLPGSSTMHTTIEGLHWTCLSGFHTRLFQDQSITWHSLMNHPKAELVKENPLRRVYHLRLNALDLYVKQYQIRYQDLLKLLLRGWPGEKEFDNLQIARSRSLAVAKPIAWAKGFIKGKPVSLLITESVGRTISLEELLWDKHVNSEKLEPALVAAAQIVAKMHCGGIQNNDLHAGNILLGSAGSNPGEISGTYRPFMMDLQKVEVEQRFGHASADPWRSSRMKNLATLLAGLRYHTSREQQELFVRSYLRAIQPHRNWTEWELRKYLQQANQLADQRFRRIWAKRARRCLRNSKYSRKIRLSNTQPARVFLEHKHPPDYSQAAQHQYTIPQWSAALADPDFLLQPGEYLKQGNRNTVMAKTIAVGPHTLDVVIKHSRLSNGFRGFIQSLYRSRALRQWHRAHMLIERHIPTAWPLAVVEKRTPFLLQESILICERIPDSYNIRQFVLEGKWENLTRHGRIELIEQIGSLLAQLQRTGLRHRDCKATNIMVQYLPKHEPVFQLYLVDLDGLRRRLPFEIWGSHEAIVRLAASAIELKPVQIRDVVRVFLSYIRNMDLPEVKDRKARHQFWQKLSKLVLQKNQTK